jgi:hypothetical protein
MHLPPVAENDLRGGLQFGRAEGVALFYLCLFQAPLGPASAPISGAARERIQHHCPSVLHLEHVVPERVRRATLAQYRHAPM